MLAPDDRQLLLTQLQPPPGMTLGHAVGATFTLDLESALVAPFAAASRVLADKLQPIAALEALRSTTDRIDIFFQNGHLAAPTARSGLHAFLEQVLHPVVEPIPGHLFHPKFWLLKFVPAGDPAAPLVESLFRLVVTSRNILQVLQEQLGLESAADWRAAYSVFQAGVASWQNMREHHHRYRERWGELDAAIVTEVRAVAAAPGADGSPSLVDHFGELVDEYGERTPQIEQAWRAAADGFRRGRSILSLAGIKILEPDLVILDEFQRFKDLLNASSPSGELGDP